jgi:hypothetical protein
MTRETASISFLPKFIKNQMSLTILQITFLGTSCTIYAINKFVIGILKAVDCQIEIELKIHAVC